MTASESVRTLVSRAQQLTKEDSLYEALGMYECGAFDGGCHICADALILAAGRGGLVRLVDDKGRTDHYGAKIDGLYCDFSGCYTTGDLWAKALASLAPPLDERFKCCTVLSWYGTRAEVAYYKDLFGL